MAEPKVSVLMSVRNGERHLAEAVESILGQSFGDLELIVVDDGSSDGTPSLLARYGDPRLRRLRNEKPLGLTRSLGRALGAARGAFVARQDADDRSLPERLRRQVEFLDAHPGVGLLGTAYHVIDGAGARREVQRHPPDDCRIRWQMLFHNAFCHTSVMLRRKMLGEHRLGYDETLPFSQDYDLWARVLEVSAGANLEAPLVELRLHGASVSATRRADQQGIADRVSRRQLAALIGERCPAMGQVSVLRRCYYRMPDDLSESELAACRLFLTALDAFAGRHPEAAAFVAGERRNWVERLMAASRRPLATGAALLPEAPAAVLRAAAKGILGR